MKEFVWRSEIASECGVSECGVSECGVSECGVRELVSAE